MTKNPNITVEFIEYARQAPKIYHWFYCQVCGHETDHDIYVNGHYEYYTCHECNVQVQYKVR